jgi:Asp-tRNA(Asn)/Glu-tRNA(Gln) amidotransferase B subunit
VVWLDLCDDFADPDLPPLGIAPEWGAREKAEMPELPRASGGG